MVPINILRHEHLARNSEGLVNLLVVDAHFLPRYTLWRDLCVKLLFSMLILFSHLRNDSHTPFDEPGFACGVVLGFSLGLLRHKLIQCVSTQSRLEESSVWIIQRNFLGAYLLLLLIFLIVYWLKVVYLRVPPRSGTQIFDNIDILELQGLRWIFEDNILHRILSRHTR